MDQEVFTISLNIKQLEDIFLQEEENYVMNLYEKFQNAWNEVSLGEAMITQTAKLFNTGNNSIPGEIFQLVHKQIRYVASPQAPYPYLSNGAQMKTIEGFDDGSQLPYTTSRASGFATL